jgi:hypothetical protein
VSSWLGRIYWNCGEEDCARRALGSCGNRRCNARDFVCCRCYIESRAVNGNLMGSRRSSSGDVVNSKLGALGNNIYVVTARLTDEGHCLER